MNQESQIALENLPEDVRNVINSDLVPEKLKEIGAKYLLHIDQIGILEEEVANVMLGLSRPDAFVDRIESRLDISTDTAINIATDINVEIFLSIRESLIKMQEESEANETEAAPEPVLTNSQTAETKPEPSLSVSDLEATPELPEGVTSKEDLLAEIETHAAAIPPLSAVKPAAPASKPAQPVQAQPQKPPEKPKTYATDPYREPLM